MQTVLGINLIYCKGMKIFLCLRLR